MAQWLENEQFGDGSDGNYAPSTSTDAPIDSACTGTAGTKSLTATNASFAAGQMILIIQTYGSGAGYWELNVIDSYSTGTITTKYPLNTYGSSGSHSYVTGAQVLVVPQYANGLIDTGVTVTGKAWNGTVGGIIAKTFNGTLDVPGSLTAYGKGFAGGLANSSNNSTGEQGRNISNTYSRTYVQNSGAGGGGTVRLTNEGGHSGGGGAYGQNGTDGVFDALYQYGPGGQYGRGGVAYGSADMTTAFFGSGGGGGGVGDAQGGGTTGRGGYGGGLIFLFARNLSPVTGSISVNGQDGYTGAYDQAGGGGGAGGGIVIKTLSGDVGTSKVTAAAGAGGPKGTSGAAGGAGGYGRIRVDYQDSVSGTTSPTLSSGKARLSSGFFGGVV